MLKYFISILLITNSLTALSQDDIALDSIPLKTTYGIKIGIDISKQIRMLTEPNYKGLVLTGDYRILDRLFLAAEFGSEEKKTSNEVLDFDTDGTFLKLGVNYNIYNNRKGLDNEIYVGFRYGLRKIQSQIKLLYYLRFRSILESKLCELVVSEFYRFNTLVGFEFVLGFNAEVLNNTYSWG